MSTSPEPKASLAQFAKGAEISPRAAQLAVKRCLQGDTWRGNRLRVEKVYGRGGRGGVSYVIYMDSMPPDVREHTLEQFPHLAEPPEQRSIPRRRKPRGDRDRERLLFLRRLFAAAGLPEEARNAITAGLDQETKCIWASKAQRDGWRKVATNASLHLFKLCKEHGAARPEAELLKLCNVPKSYVCHPERRVHRKTDIYRHDAKAFQDTAPYQCRRRPKLPLQCVVVDVTPLDVRFLCPDGREVKVSLISSADWATNRLFVHAYPRPKGHSVRQEHTACSLLALCSAVGVPETVYADRGAEYGWVKLLEEAGLCHAIRARPYGARAKIIEGLFRQLIHRFISQIEGYLGSDRFRKKSQSVGRPTDPFPGTWEELHKEIYRQVELYNATDQDALGGRSPNQAWQATLDAGWRPRKTGPETVIQALVCKEQRKVNRGTIRLGGALYTSDALCDWRFEGEVLTVHKPLIPGFPPSVFAPNGDFIDHVFRIEPTDWDDTAGAAESQRRQGIRRASARALEKAAPPADLRPYHEAFLTLNPPPGDVSAGETVELPGERGRAAAARRALPAPSPEAEIDRRARQRELLRGVEPQPSAPNSKEG